MGGITRTVCILMLALIPAQGFGQVYTSPAPGVFQNVGLQPEMSQGYVSPPNASSSPGDNDYTDRGPYQPSRFQDQVINQNPGLRQNPNYPGMPRQNPSGAAGFPGNQAQSFPVLSPGQRREPMEQGFATDSPEQTAAATEGRRLARRPSGPATTSIWQKNATGSYFGILGAVFKPAVYFHAQRQISLSELLKLAGGPTNQASGGVRIIRQGRGGLQTFLSLESTFELFNGDVVLIEGRKQLTQSGLREFSHPLQTVGADHAPGHESDVVQHATQQGAAPKTSYLSFVNLTNKPIVVPVPSDRATLDSAMLWLGQDPKAPPTVRVLSPNPQFRLAAGELAGQQPLEDGTVLVFDPATVRRESLPNFPPVIGEVDAKDAGDTPPTNHILPPGETDLNSSVRVRAPSPLSSPSVRPLPRGESTVPGEFKLKRPPSTSAVGSGIRPDNSSPHFNARTRGQTPSRPFDSALPALDVATPVASTPEDNNHSQNDSLDDNAGPLMMNPPMMQRPDRTVESNERRPGAPQRPNSGRVIPEGTATPAGFEGQPPSLIPEGHQNAFDFEHANEADDVPPGNEPEGGNLQNLEFPLFQRTEQASSDSSHTNKGTDRSELVEPGDKTPSATTALSDPPFLKTTTGTICLSLTVMLTVFAGLWIGTRWDRRAQRKIQVGSPVTVEDLIHNRLSMTTEPVAIPEKQLYHGRPTLPTAQQERVTSRIVPQESNVPQPVHMVTAAERQIFDLFREAHKGKIVRADAAHLPLNVPDETTSMESRAGTQRTQPESTNRTIQKTESVTRLELPPQQRIQTPAPTGSTLSAASGHSTRQSRTSREPDSRLTSADTESPRSPGDLLDRVLAVKQRNER